MTFFNNHHERKATVMKPTKKAKAALCILLACLLAAGCACAKTITLPDLGDFVAGKDDDIEIEIYKNQPLNRYYHMSSNRAYGVLSPVSYYVSVLTKDYGFTIEEAIVSAAGAHEGDLIPNLTLGASADARVMIGCGPYEEGSAQTVLVDWFEGVSMTESAQKDVSRQDSSGETATREKQETKKKPSAKQSAKSTPRPTPKATEKPRRSKCSALGCNGGKVKCRKCDGKGYKIKTVTVPNYSGKSKTTKEQKEYCSCSFGYNSCTKCGGDGWVND